MKTKTRDIVNWVVAIAINLVAVVGALVLFSPAWGSVFLAYLAILGGLTLPWLLVIVALTFFNLRRKIPFRVGLLAHIIYRKQKLRYAELTAFAEANDPEHFLHEIDAFLATKRLHRGLAQMAEYCRAFAYLQMGETTQALAIYEQFVQTEQELRDNYNYKNEPLKAYLHHNLCAALLAGKQLERAKEHYNIVLQMQGSKQVQRAPATADAKKKFPIIDAAILLLEGQHEAARDAYQQLLQDPERGKEYYDFHFHLATIYETLGDTQQQTEHLRQTIALGNQHYYVRIAQEKLAQLD